MHTTFQQNKDCNRSAPSRSMFRISAVAYDLPAKQGLQLGALAHRTSDVVCHVLHTTFQQNKDCNSVLSVFSIFFTSHLLHTTFQQNKDCNYSSVSSISSRSRRRCIRPSSKTRTATVMDEVVSGLVIALHTTFQQNKDCNSLSNVQVVIFLTKAVAYDLPAKQGLQSDSNKVKRTLISDLHTTLPPKQSLRPGISDSKSWPATWMLHLHPPAEQPALDYAEELRDRVTGGLSRLSRGGRRDCGCRSPFPGRTGHTMD